jgi:hypothetical protein
MSKLSAPKRSEGGFQGYAAGASEGLACATC